MIVLTYPAPCMKRLIDHRPSSPRGTSHAFCRDERRRPPVAADRNAGGKLGRRNDVHHRSGWGALTILIVAVVTIVVGAIVRLLLGTIGHPNLAFLAASIGLFAAVGVNWIVGKRKNATPPRELVDPATGERLMITRTHRLFWIRMEYRSIPLAPLALVPWLALPGAIKG